MSIHYVGTIPQPYIITVLDQYGETFETLRAPEGYQFTGAFRPAQNLESWLTTATRSRGSGGTLTPVLILRPLPKRKRIIFEEVGKLPAGSRIAGDEWYSIPGHEEIFKATHASSVCTFALNTTLYSRREEEF